MSNSENPFKIHRDLLSHIVSIRDDSVAQFNKHFKEKPSDDMIIDLLDGWEIRADENVVLRKQRLARKRFGDLECHHITLSFDKKQLKESQLTQAPTGDRESLHLFNHWKIKESMLDFIHNFQTTNYKWAIDPVGVCEFNTKSGFNPHIHIIARKNYGDCSVKTASQIQQLLRRKYVENKKNNARFGIYSVHVKKLPINKGEDYVNGLKQDSKLNDVKKDERYRKEYGYAPLYYLFDLA